MTNIGVFVSQGERPGIYIQIKNWKKVLEKLGYNVYFFAPELSFETDLFHPLISKIYKNSFLRLKDYNEQGLLSIIEDLSRRIEKDIDLFIEKNRIDILILENILSGAYNIPYGIALGNIVLKTTKKTIAHHHSFWWDIPSSKPTSKGIRQIIERYFPLVAPHVTHITVNTIAQAALKKKKGIFPRIVPYMCDMAEFSCSDKRIRNDEITFFHPYYADDKEGLFLAREIVSGVNERKNLLDLLGKKKAVLFIDKLSPNIDLVLYTKFYEPWGDYLLEAIKLGIPILIYPYKVFKRDISHFEFDLMIYEGLDDALSKVEKILLKRGRREKMKRHNLSILERCFSLKMLEKYIKFVLRGEK